MRIILFIGVFLFCGLNLSAQLKKGAQTLGYSIGFTTATKSGIMNADYRYSLTDAFRIAPSVSRLIKDSGYKGWLLDTNLHYLITPHKGYAFYPLVGLSFSYWDYYDKEKKKYSKGESFWGPNVGLGTEVYIVDELILGLDLKYNIIKKHDQALVAFRIAYHFSSY